MVTRLRAPLRREIRIGGQPYTVTISQEGMKLVEKGRRKGHELAWKDLLSGEAALATALNASLRAAPVPRSAARPSRQSGRPRARRR
jgi:hypothetical protein